jgi:hypothetical protein
MSIWKELYDIFDKERAKWQKSGASKQALLFEMQSNLTFLADALQNELGQMEVVKGLERTVFEQSLKDGYNFNKISRQKVTDKTIDGFEEFKKYVGKDTDYLIKNAYSKMRSLTKLVNASSSKDHTLKIKSLFRFLMLLVAHIEGRPLTRRSTKKGASSS